MVSKNISFDKVKLKDGYWKTRYELNAEVSIYSVKDVFEKSGRFDALRFIEGNKNVHWFYDSDVAKWIEAVAYLIAENREKYTDLEQYCDGLISDIKKNQRDDGYFNSYFMQVEPENIFKKRNGHELYCAGHLIEAAVAYHKYTGKREMLDCMLKYVSYIRKVFFVEKSAGFTTPGHEEIELALFKLYEHTGNPEHKELAEYFVDMRGNNELDKASVILSPKNIQEDVPARRLSLAEGHAVRATYFYSAMADYARVENDSEMFDACERIFKNIYNRKMFITGGVGSSRIGESFTVDYDLPNLSAYSESCAAIGFAFFCKRMSELSADAIYADVVERIFYNGFSSSTSIDGKKFFYENPLEVCRRENGKEIAAPENRRTILPIFRRQELFSCSCCPPNINRFVASVAGLIFNENDEGIYINQYTSCSLGEFGLNMTTGYPFDGKITVTAENYGRKKLYMRIPLWCDAYKFTLDGKDITPKVAGGYAEINVKEKFFVVFDMKLNPKFTECNPRVRENSGKVALTYGPVVYCLEEADNGADLFALSVCEDTDEFGFSRTDWQPFPVISCKGVRRISDDGDALYAQSYREKETVLKFIPYYAFANREESDMTVWVNAFKKRK